MNLARFFLLVCAIGSIQEVAQGALHSEGLVGSFSRHSEKRDKDKEKSKEKDKDKDKDSEAGKGKGALFDNLTREKALSVLAAIMQLVQDKYVEPVQLKKILEGAISGILVSLDPHSFYFNEADFKDLYDRTKGEFGGLGMEVTMENGIVKVISPIDGTPAEIAGIRGQDLIIAIDDVPVTGMSLLEAVKKMRGAPGTQVKLLIKREGSKPFVKLLKRALVQVKSVKWREMKNVGYVRISTFDEKTTTLLKEGILALQKNLGDNLEGFVLDLRNNPGGRLDQAVSVVNLFLDKGNVVSTRGRERKDQVFLNAESGKMIAKDLPVVVIINGNSASASEIVAGALQDHQRALVVGEKSFGKGSVQALIPLGYNGKEGGIKLTVARFFTPKGRSIQKDGIVPDIEIEQVEVSKMEQPLLQISEKMLPGALKEDLSGEKRKVAEESSHKAKAFEERDAHEGKKRKEVIAPIAEKEKSKEDDSKDFQLIRARELVRALHLFRKMREKRALGG